MYHILLMFNRGVNGFEGSEGLLLFYVSHARLWQIRDSDTPWPAMPLVFDLAVFIVFAVQECFLLSYC